MDEKMFEKGLAKRKATLGDDFVEGVMEMPTTSPARFSKP